MISNAVLKKVLEEQIAKNEKNEQEDEKIPVKPEGYDTIISSEEFEAILQIKKAVNKFITLHNKNVLKLFDESFMSNTYGCIQYLMFSDAIEDLVTGATKAVSIHALSKDKLDESCNSY